MRKTLPDPFYAIPLLIFFIAYLNSSFIQALKIYLTIYCTFSFLLMKILLCGHRIQDTWTEGCEKIEDYGEHTINATSDTDVWITGIWSYLLLAGFNVHMAHHLFPTADHHILP
jgi:fatty acid desaturase